VKKRLEEEKEKLKKMDPQAVGEDDEGSEIKYHLFIVKN
jgi:hypothetical protein